MRKVLLAALAATFGQSAYAAVCFDFDGGACDTSSYTLEQVFLDNFLQTDGSLLGHIGSQTSTDLVTFDSTDSIGGLGSGFARISGADDDDGDGFNGLTDLTWTADPLLMDAMTFSVRGASGLDMMIDINLDDGSVFSDTFTLTSGLDKFELFADPESMLDITLTALDTFVGPNQNQLALEFEIEEFKQLRLATSDGGGAGGGGDPDPVSAPGGVALLSIGLLGLIRARRNR